MDPLLPALASEPEMATGHALFLYGPVLTPGFVTRLLEHPVSGLEACLPDHTLRDSREVLVASPGDSVTGFLYLCLDGEDFRRLDAYHGVGEGLYRRELRAVATAGGQREREPGSAWVYLPTERTLERYL